MAFHEKAGRSQGNFGFIVSFCSLSQRKVFLPPSSHCRHASIRTLEERSVFARCMWGVLNSAGAAICLATCRSRKSRTRPRRLTQSPELGFSFCLSSLGTILTWFLLFCFTQLPQPSLGCYCAKARILLHSPTGDAATPPAFLPWRQSLASYRFFHRARPASGPSA